MADAKSTIEIQESVSGGVSLQGPKRGPSWND
jgi:hypothetical protein